MRPTIDHDPDEVPPRKFTAWIWWVAWALIGVLWAADWYSGDLVPNQLVLGFITGAILALWVVALKLAERGGYSKF